MAKAFTMHAAGTLFEPLALNFSNIVSYNLSIAGVCLFLAAKFFMDMKKSEVKDLLEVH